MKEIKYRHEYKFYINYVDYHVLRSRLRLILKMDSHAGDEGKYLIRSLYFDDYKNSALVE
ncbi:MAG: molecular chaperone, partial [Epulopiscium sp.]|nr:molecular chaperone [Candidatus Epulonipiscium sp.]